jgi:hypothetical protein
VQISVRSEPDRGKNHHRHIQAVNQRPPLQSSIPQSSPYEQSDKDCNDQDELSLKKQDGHLWRTISGAV